MGLDREDYNLGYTLWTFDLTPDGSASSGTHWSPMKQGNFRIELKFAKNLPTAITCIVYAEFDSLLQVDKQRSVKIS